MVQYKCITEQAYINFQKKDNFHNYFENEHEYFVIYKQTKNIAAYLKINR